MQNPFEYIKDILNDSCHEATRHYCKVISVEHLLLSILNHDNATLQAIFDKFGINTQVLRATLDDSQRNKPVDSEEFEGTTFM